jgi:hypothetical protein
MKLRMIGLLLGVLACKAMAAPLSGIPDGWSNGFVYANGLCPSTP